MAVDMDNVLLEACHIGTAGFVPTNDVESTAADFNVIEMFSRVMYFYRVKL